MVGFRSLANAFSYWQYQDISNATHTYFDDLAAALGHVQEVTGSLDKVHFMNGGEYTTLHSNPNSYCPHELITDNLTPQKPAGQAQAAPTTAPRLPATQT